jgi:hypothetical protein
MNSFWDKVNNCQHEFYDNYCVYLPCDTPYCSGYEVHCKKCGVYISKCNCGYNNGMSGWPYKRWFKEQFLKKKNEKYK